MTSSSEKKRDFYRWLKALLIKDFEQTGEGRVRARYGTAAGALGIASNILLFGVKLAVGLITGSVSVTADAINNLSDAGTSIVTFFGFKLSSRPPDAEHPFGHARYEYLSGLIVSLTILAIGVLLGRSSIEKILSPSPVEASALAIALIAASIPVKIWQAGLYKNFARAIDSSALSASAADSRNDVLATLSVILAIAAERFFPGHRIDGAVGLLVSLFIVISSLKLLKETRDPLLGTTPDRETVQTLSKKVLASPGVLGLHDLIVHNYGPASRFATLHVELPAETSLIQSHDLADKIEREVMRDMGIFLVIHVDPVVQGDEEADALQIRVLNTLRAAIGKSVSLHDFRLVRGSDVTRVVFDAVLPFGTSWDRSAVEKMLEKSLNDGAEGKCRRFEFLVNIDQADDSAD